MEVCWQRSRVHDRGVPQRDVALDGTCVHVPPNGGGAEEEGGIERRWQSATWNETESWCACHPLGAHWQSRVS